MGQALIEHLSVNMRALSKQHLIDLSQIGKLTSQVLRNLTTTYESALTLLALVARGMPGDLGKAHLIANTFNYTLHHDNHGNLIPVAPDNSVGCFDGDRDAPRCGLHNGYTSGDVALFNDQASPAEGRKGDIRLSGFSCGVSPTGFCVTLDGTTGGNNAFAILALAAGYKQFNDQRYFGAAKKIGEWIVSNLRQHWHRLRRILLGISRRG